MPAARIVRVLTLIAVLVVGAVHPIHSQGASANPEKTAALKMALRDLYTQHIFWVRDLVTMTRLGQSAGAKEADEYGLNNATAIGKSIAPYYGEAAAQKFVSLFTGHYAAVKAYMRAAFANNFRGNTAAKKTAVDQLTKNADAIAAFVSGANPNLPKATVYGLLLTHGQQHVKSIDATAKKDWADEADMWEPMVKHIYTLTDALADGIAKQFPDKFQ